MAKLTLTTPQALGRALAAYRAGKRVEAEQICQQIVRAGHDRGAALHLLAVIQSSLGKQQMALANYDRALAARPDDAALLSNRGLVLHALRRFDEALASYDRALAVQPQYAEALCNRGLTLHELKRFDEALASYERALTVRPQFAEALFNRGVALHTLKRFEEALTGYDRALTVRPDFVEVLFNRGVALHELGRLDEALTSYDRALSLRPDYAEALSNRANTLRELKRFAEALANYDRAIALRPDFAEALCNRGNALQELSRPEEALASYDRALAVRPDYAEALFNRGNILKELKRLEAALASYDRALAVQPDHAHAFNGIADCLAKLCDWSRTNITAELIAHVAQKKSIISPFTLFGYSDDPALQLQCARNFVAGRIGVLPPKLWSNPTWRHDKIRLAYLSADFHRHATAHLTAGLFERHDRSRFETIGVSFGPDDNSELRLRLIAAFDQFHDVSSKSDDEVAQLLRHLQVDLAIDLKGYTQDARFGVLARRPAPIQVNYLGFPGTMAAPFIDYIVADNTLIPFEHQPFYTEKIVHLPGSYQVNDDRRKIAERTPTRLEAALPEQGFVFCCFNGSWKINAKVFDVWMRLLHAVDGSVLWLLRDNPGAERNLRNAARARGIDPGRLVFAGRVPLEEHLARHRLADLFLDTLPYNAHTTASDTLWSGLPLITQKGDAFPGRVAASLLNAIGLPELVTHSTADYEALARRLATDRSLLTGYRNRLAENRLTYPLFDTDRFRRHIEAAYLQMWEIWQRGEEPRSFAVKAMVDETSLYATRTQTLRRGDRQ